MKSLSRVQLFVTPWTLACTRLLCPWDFLGKSTGVGCHFLLQGIFLIQGANPHLLHRLADSSPPGKGSPRTCTHCPKTDQCYVISMNSREHRQKIKRLWMSYPNCLDFNFLSDGSVVKESSCQYRRLGFDPWVRKIP